MGTVWDLNSSGNSGFGFANGAAIKSPSLSAYSSGVYNTPQFFQFAKGGVFAEAGYEAIMPLSRGPDGKLGVKAAGGAGANVTVLVENHSGSQARTEETTGPDGNRMIKVIIDAAVGEVDRRIGTMGSTGRAIAGRFGLQPAGVSRG